MKTSKMYFVGIMLSVLASVAATFIPLYLQKFIDSESQKAGLRGYLVIILLLFVFQLLVQVIANLIISKSVAEKITRLRGNLINQVIFGKVKDLHHESSGSIASRIVNDVSEIREYWINNLPRFISGLWMILFSIIFLIQLDWKLTGILFLSLPIIGLLIAPISSLNSRHTVEYQAEQATFTANIVEMVRSLIKIKADQMEGRQETLLKNQADVLGKIGFRVDMISGLASPLILFVLFGMIGIIFTYGGIRVEQGTLTVGTLIAFLVYLFQLLTPVSSLSNFFNQKAKVTATYEGLETIMAIAKEDNEGSQHPQIGDIEISNLTFAYNQDLILKDVSLQIQQGMKVAFVGPSGSGKTTLINLILRIYNPVEGNISLSGVDIRGIDLFEYRSLFSYVTQEVGLMSGSILENIVSGGTYQSDEVESVLKEVGLFDDIDKMKQGLQTDVGEGGKLLSGGQKQRLMIARALLKNTPYLIFDEATSNLDVESENKIRALIKKFHATKTILMIAHRLSTIKDADCIFFVQEGQITGVGTHDDLFNHHVTYREYIESQKYL